MKKILVEGKELGFKGINLNGGEPLEYKHFENTLKLANKLGYFICIITNGWDFENHKELILKYKVGRLMFGLDGMKHETHDLIRGNKGSFDRVIKAIKEAKKLDFIVGINYVITPQNYQEIDELFKFLKENDIKELQLFKAAKDGRAYLNNYLELNNQHIKQIKKILNNNTDFLKSLDFLNCVFLGEKASSNLCNYLQLNTLAIDWKGRLNLCSLSNMYGIKFPSLAEKSLIECIQDLHSINKRYKQIWKQKRPNWEPENKYDYCEFCFEKFRNEKIIS
jgi:MoaA/NifB/PqqE/SkfB family radical SAM enzyme